MNNCYFYVPALRLDSLTKMINNLAIKMIVVDLEDSIHPRSKELARDAITNFDFNIIAKQNIQIGIRINSINNYHGLRDMQFLKEMDENKRYLFEHIFIPKVNCRRDLEIYRDLFGNFSYMPKLFTFIETVPAVNNAYEIATLSDALCFGQADLSSIMFQTNTAYIDYARAVTCIAAAQNNILSIDNNSFEINNMAILEQDCEIAKKAGFTSKVAIHPNQIETINKFFSVSTDEIKKYKSCIEAYENNNVGFIIQGNDVIAPPFVAKAKNMLKLYEKM